MEKSLNNLIDLEALERCIEANPQRAIVLQWVIDEWDRYSNVKWSFKERSTHMEHEHEAIWMKGSGLQSNGEWARQIFQYLDRATIFGVGEKEGAPERGKQAAMKMATTLLDALSVMIKVFGTPPTPGFPSGDISEWQYSLDDPPSWINRHRYE